jgi:hypothetical protein
MFPTLGCGGHFKTLDKQKENSQKLAVQLHVLTLFLDGLRNYTL